MDQVSNQSQLACIMVFNDAGSGELKFSAFEVDVSSALGI